MPCVCAFFFSYLINLPLAWSTISQYNHRSQLLSLQPSFPNRKISSVFELRLNWWCSFWSKVPFNQNKISRIVTPSTWIKKQNKTKLNSQGETINGEKEEPGQSHDSTVSRAYWALLGTSSPHALLGLEMLCNGYQGTRLSTTEPCCGISNKQAL